MFFKRNGKLITASTKSEAISKIIASDTTLTKEQIEDSGKAVIQGFIDKNNSAIGSLTSQATNGVIHFSIFSGIYIPKRLVKEYYRLYNKLSKVEKEAQDSDLSMISCDGYNTIIKSNKEISCSTTMYLKSPSGKSNSISIKTIGFDINSLIKKIELNIKNEIK